MPALGKLRQVDRFGFRLPEKRKETQVGREQEDEGGCGDDPVTPDWLLSAFSFRPPAQLWPRRAAGGGSRGVWPGGAAEVPGRAPAAAGCRLRGCGAGPWPGHGAWWAGWAASCCCQVSSVGRGPGRAAFLAWELSGGASPSLGPVGAPKGTLCGREHWQVTPSPRREAHTRTRGVALSGSWVEHHHPQPAAGLQAVQPGN